MIIRLFEYLLITGKLSAGIIFCCIKSDSTVTTSKFLSLETFRGLAAVMIVLHHSRFFAGSTYVPFVRHSDIFVDFFFILSGFVMAYLYLDKIGSKVRFRKAHHHIYFAGRPLVVFQHC